VPAALTGAGSATSAVTGAGQLTRLAEVMFRLAVGSVGGFTGTRFFPGTDATGAGFGIRFFTAASAGTCTAIVAATTAGSTNASPR
jgi:hypothetical protein